MRPHEATFIAPMRYHDATPSSYRTMLANVGETYQSNRYPPFHERTGQGGYGYEDEVRYF